jgi:hypothetical protein
MRSTRRPSEIFHLLGQQVTGRTDVEIDHQGSAQGDVAPWKS